ncbi:MAG: serine hydrolase [Oligosphaeraceae bacterium]
MRKSISIILSLLLFSVPLAWFLWSTRPNRPVAAPAPQETPAAAPSQEPTAPVPSSAGVPAAKPSVPPAVKPPVAPVATPPAAASSGMPGRYRPDFFPVAEKPMKDSLRQEMKEVRSGVVLDLDTRTILWQKDAARSYPMASLTKLMTSILLMEYLEQTPGVTLQTPVTVTAEDRKYFREKKINGVFLDTGESYRLEEYLMCMLVSSANDCAYVVGRYLAGGAPERFPEMMNRRAADLGLQGMHFYNPNGLPLIQGGQRLENTGSALEVAYLALRAIQYPAIRKWASTVSGRIRADKKNPFDVNSTNKLLRGKVPGVNGLKTGFTDGAGYCIVVTCEREGRKRMVVVMGVQGSDRGRRRDELATKLLEWSYQP